MMPREDWAQVAIVIYVTLQFGLGMAIVLAHLVR